MLWKITLAYLVFIGRYKIVRYWLPVKTNFPFFDASRLKQAGVHKIQRHFSTIIISWPWFDKIWIVVWSKKGSISCSECFPYCIFLEFTYLILQNYYAAKENWIYFNTSTALWNLGSRHVDIQIFESIFIDRIIVKFYYYLSKKHTQLRRLL